MAIRGPGGLVEAVGERGPFYRDLFAEAGVRTVLDTACGTGHHAEMFHSWGLASKGLTSARA